MENKSTQEVPRKSPRKSNEHWYVVLHWFATKREDVQYICHSKAGCTRFINKKMESQKYSGMEVYSIRKVELND